MSNQINNFLAITRFFDFFCCDICFGKSRQSVIEFETSNRVTPSDNK